MKTREVEGLAGEIWLYINERVDDYEYINNEEYNIYSNDEASQRFESSEIDQRHTTQCCAG